MGTDLFIRRTYYVRRINRSVPIKHVPIKHLAALSPTYTQRLLSGRFPFGQPVLETLRPSDVLSVDEHLGDAGASGDGT